MATPQAVIIAQSTENIYIQITSVLPTGVNFDPTIYPVDVCIVPTGTTPETYLPATWLTGVPVPTVAFLVGPLNGGQPLSAGNYDVYVQITTPVEVPVIPCGVLQVRTTSP